MIEDPRHFDAYFRRATVAAAPAAARQEQQPIRRLLFTVHCGKHPSRELVPLPGEEWPTLPLEGSQSVRLGCPECDEEVVLSFESTQEDPP